MDTACVMDVLATNSDIERRALSADCVRRGHRAARAGMAEGFSDAEVIEWVIDTYMAPSASSPLWRIVAKVALERLVRYKRFLASYGPHEPLPGLIIGAAHARSALGGLRS